MEQFRVLVVDDEPAALRYLASRVEKAGCGFVVCGQAENGSDALARLDELAPDLIISDIRMPVMDGLNLAAAIKSSGQGLPIVMVSGHQDFEYARQAIRHGVVEYLLKPVNAAQLAETLTAQRERLGAERYETCSSLLRSLVNGFPVDPELARRKLPGQYYFMAILRVGNLPSRFPQLRSENLAEKAAAFGPFREAGCWALSGSDEQELLIAASPAQSGGPSWQDAIRAFSAQLGAEAHTIVMQAESLAREDLAATAEQLRVAVRQHLRIGVTQIRNRPDLVQPDPLLSTLDPVQAKHLAFLAAEGRFTELRPELLRCLSGWHNARLPQLAMETMIKQLIGLLLQGTGRYGDIAPAVVDRLVDQACSGASDMPALADNIWNILEDLAQLPESTPGNADVPQFFGAIKQHLARNLEQAITLPGICEQFGISQSYLSKLFRRFEGMSLGDYLTMLRIDSAKRLLRESPLMPLKQVAAASGFRDQFYFSRVFKAMTGQAPSAFGKTSE